MPFTFTVANGALNISNGDVDPKVRMSLNQFTPELAGNRIRVSGNFGKWDRIFYFDDFGTVDGVSPGDLEEAYDLLVLAQTEVNQANNPPVITERIGVANVVLGAGENTVSFQHGLPGMNWVDLQYADPALGDIYLADVSFDATDVFIFSDNAFPADTYTIYYRVAIIPE